MKKPLLTRHLQLRNMLFKHWKTKGLKKGEKIESQNDIKSFCDFSLITIIKTLNDLQAEGIIQRKVGKGSYLQNAPWFTSHLRIGFFYNREVVGGGIFNNNFYTKLVVAFEKQVISDGHEFILGSFTHKQKPVLLWDDLDAVVLTGITKKTEVEDLGKTSCLLSVIDTHSDKLSISNYRINLKPAFTEMFSLLKNKKINILYLDSLIKSPEQTVRLNDFKNVFKIKGHGHKLKLLNIDQEFNINQTDNLIKAILSFKPDMVCGYVHPDWYDLIEKVSSKKVNIYSLLIDFGKQGFIVNSDKWMNEILPDIYARLDNRSIKHQPSSYKAEFIK
ncbi:MAG: hypothetical protein HOI06_03570 [Pelagibacteraceae bacterium]|nr:hypothetical protein [Pelagibacteraceae bacterium]